MIVPAEYLLMGIAAGLYLYDSLLLLYCNEAVLFRRGNRWQVGFGSPRLNLGGRELYLPNPLTPHRSIYRLRWWSEGPATAPSATDWETLAQRFSPLTPFLAGIALALFVLLPLGLFTRLGDAMILGALACLYANILAALAWVGLRRQRHGLSRGALVAIALECLICPPCALNLVRKLSLRATPGDTLLPVARKLQKAEDLALTCAACIARLDEEIEGEADGGHLASIQALRAEFARETAGRVR